MSTKQVQHLKGGRPVGAKSTDPAIAQAFGQAVVALRAAQGVSQEGLALGCSASALVTQFESEMSVLKGADTNQ